MKLDGATCLAIRDDSKRLQEGRLLHAKRKKRLGLLGMRERLEMVGGNFAITSAPGKGTTIWQRTLRSVWLRNHSGATLKAQITHIPGPDSGLTLSVNHRLERRTDLRFALRSASALF